MLQSGDWVVPHLYDEPRTAKPVLIYWCQAIAMKLFGDNAFAARLPSVIAMAATLVVVAVAVWKTVGPQRAVWTTFVLATSGLVIACTARMCLTDSVLLLWITIAQLCLYAVWRGNGSWLIFIVMGVAIALAGLTKGPLVLAIVGMTMVALWVIGRTAHNDRRAQLPQMLWLKILVSTTIIVLIVAPWLILLNQRAPEFLGTSVGHDVIKRALQPLERHSGPPGYYLLTIWGTFFPWSVLLVVALWFGWRHRRLPPVRFALAAVVGPWVLFEVVQTKLPHYLLPCFVPLAFLTGDAIVRCLRRQYDDFEHLGFRAAQFIWAAAVIAIGVLPWTTVGKLDGVATGAKVAWTMLALAYATSVLVLFHRDRPREALVALGVGMMAAMVIMFGWVLPNAQFLRLPVNVAEILRRDGGAAPNAKVDDVIMIEFKEPSLAFYQGGTIREERDKEFLTKTEPARWPKWMVVREDVWKKTPDDVKAKLDVVGSARGLAYADKGRVWEVFVVRKRAQ
jgi:4-amino-4-deoxy-L-arabinose transferase-like glycosyltransferase